MKHVSVFFIFLSLSLLYIRLPASAQNQNFENNLVAYCDSSFKSGFAKKQFAGAAISVVNPQRTLFSMGYGFGDYVNNMTVNADSTLFYAGSVGKIVTCIAAAKLVHEGRITWDEDLRIKFPSFFLKDKFDGPITLMQLLSHSAGFNDNFIGYASGYKEKIPPLQEFLKKSAVSRFQPPGASVCYSNYGYGYAGIVIELLSGKKFEEYVTENIFLPLGMRQSTFSKPPSANFLYSKGYRVSGNEYEERPFAFTYGQISPAGGVYSSAKDIAKLMMVLLNDGQYEQTRLFASGEAKQFFIRQFSNHPLLTGYTLGFEEQQFNGIKFFTKTGQVPGFFSMMILFPEYSKAIFFSATTGEGDFAKSFLSGLKRLMVSGKPETTTYPVLSTDYRGKIDFTGTYRSNRYNHSSIEKLFSLFTGKAELSDAGNGKIAMKIDKYIYVLLPTSEKNVFLNERDSSDFLIIRRNSKGKAVGFYFNADAFGIKIPVTFESLSKADNPVAAPLAFLFIVPGFFFLYLAYCFARGIRGYLKRRKKINHVAYGNNIQKLYKGLKISASLMVLLFYTGYLFPIFSSGREIVFGISNLLSILKYSSLAALIFGIISFGLFFLLTYKVKHSYKKNIAELSFFLVLAIFVFYLYHWSFLA